MDGLKREKENDSFSLQGYSSDNVTAVGLFQKNDFNIITYVLYYHIKIFFANCIL